MFLPRSTCSSSAPIAKRSAEPRFAQYMGALEGWNVQQSAEVDDCKGK